MDLSFELPDGTYGRYKWGRLVSEFAPVAAPMRQRFGDFMAGLVRYQATWQSDLEFRGQICLLHEVVHYFQDLLTGVGHWDHCVRREHQHPLLLHAVRESYLGNIPGARETEDTKAALAEYVNNLLFLPPSDLPDDRRMRLAADIARSGGVPVEKGIEQSYTVDALLECEAVALVLHFMLTARMSEEQAAIASNSVSMYMVHSMPLEYAHTFTTIAEVVSHWMDWENDRSDSRLSVPDFFRMVCTFAIFFIDVACAHPSREFLQVRKEKRSDYEPGLRLFRLVRTFQLLRGSDLSSFLSSLASKEYGSCERLLVAACEYPYAHSREIYEDWVRVFDQLIKEDDDLCLRLRRDAAQLKLDDESVTYKAPWHFIGRDIPILYIRPEKGFDLFYSGSFVDPQSQREFVYAVARHCMYYDLLQYFHYTGRFICPQGQLGICEAATPTCLGGIRTSDEFPLEKCDVRPVLSSWGFKGF